uniref:putative F-box only protein 15 n=1 Tax=Erigeron canadensis TaxID=72917 RepID=UPI001CB96675|nr:putative F-box only protein 15 [Erigeron canadensis]
MAGDLCQKIPTHIILFHILPRLPVESLQRCKSVCQQWRSFLKTRYFASMCNRRLTNGSTVDQSCHKLLFLPCYDNYEPGFRIMDCEAPDDGGGLSSQWNPLPFKYSGQDKIRIQTSLHGLVCICVQYEDWYRSKTELVLWNPLTRKYKMLGKTNPHMESYFPEVRALGLYYSGMSDDDDKEYKLLTVSYKQSFHIYSLKSDSWRKVDLADNYQTLISDLELGWEMISDSTWFNGNLYFLKGRLVLKFDTNVEKFTIIPTHPSLNDLDVKRMTMDVHKGVMHLGVHYETSQHQNSKKAHIQLWKMTEDENWDKVGVPFRIDISMYPFSRLRNKTWLMVESIKRGYFDKEEKKLHKVDYSKSYTKGKNCVTNAKSTQIISIYDSLAKVNYIESFLSIDGSI